MSGGTFGYLWCTIENIYKNELEDKQLNELLLDFCKVLHDLEWYKSDDISQEDYKQTIKQFKKKWLKY